MKSKKSLLGIVILAAIVSIGLLVFANPFKSNTQIFTESLRVLVSKSGDLTRNYQEEVGKWNMKKLDNLTMVTITDRYLSQFEELENEAKALNVPNEYENIKDSFVSQSNPKHPATNISRITSFLEIKLKINYQMINCLLPSSRN